MEVSWRSGVRIGVGVWGRADVGVTGGKLEGSKRQVGGNGWRGRWKLPPWLLFPGSCVRAVMKRTETSCNKSVHRLDQILIYLPLPPSPPHPWGTLTETDRLMNCKCKGGICVYWIPMGSPSFCRSKWGHCTAAAPFCWVGSNDPPSRTCVCVDTQWGFSRCLNSAGQWSICPADAYEPGLLFYWCSYVWSVLSSVETGV